MPRIFRRLEVRGRRNYRNRTLNRQCRYVHESEIKTFGGVAARQAMLSTGHIGRAWATNYTTTSRLPLHPSFGDPNDDFPPPAGSTASRLRTPLSHAAYSFVHGGLAPNYPQLSPFPSAINALGRSLLRKLQHRVQPPPHPPNPYPGLPPSATPEEQAMYGSDGPLWYRGWALNDEAEVCREVDAVLEKTGTRRMIMGHTPNLEVCEFLLGHRVTFMIRRRKSCRVAMARSLLLIPVSSQVHLTHNMRKSEMAKAFRMRMAAHYLRLV
jgi:hypothetical protein